MKISIVTIVRNNVSQIGETMDSVLNQNYSDLEYIVIDGGSTDGTVAEIEKRRDRLGGFVSEPDNGIYDAMNKGIDRSTGDLIGIINSGDYYYPGAFDIVSKSFAGRDLDNSIFWGDVNYEKLGRIKGFRSRNRFRGAFAPHPSMFVPRRVYERIGIYDTSFKLLGDYDFMYRAVNKFGLEVIYVPELIAFYREGGLSDRNIVACLRDELRVKLKYGQSPLKAKSEYFLKLIKNLPRIQLAKK
ncbi:MAG: glycosyltransferase [Victivallales bacterium]|nr:glycosyltransferase [Victivallales bacterium]